MRPLNVVKFGQGNKKPANFPARKLAGAWPHASSQALEPLFQYITRDKESTSLLVTR